MLKRSIAAIRQWLSFKQSDPNTRQVHKDSPHTTKRGFLKKAALGFTSVTATAGLSKVVVDSVKKPELKKLYEKDSVSGETELTGREYVVMTNQEKTQMLQTFIDDYKSKT